MSAYKVTTQDLITVFANCGHLAVTFLSPEQPTIAFWESVKTDGFFASSLQLRD